MKRMKAEWEKQTAILLAFPHKNSDWIENIQAARKNFLAIINQIILFQKVIVCVDNKDFEGEEILKNIKSDKIQIVKINTNDTWARDFGPISIEEDGEIKLLDFGFNGWGLKFRADFDNQINRNLYQKKILKQELKTMPIILEGGSIDTDGEGRILTNIQCLLESNRNPHLNQFEIEKKLKETLGAKEVLWLHSGYLAGDDTDSHIDTLARFINPQSIAYIKCEDKNDEHYESLCKMENELKSLKTKKGKSYHLIPLPFTNPIYKGNERLPASYANFLFINNALLVPTYGDKKDKNAVEILQKACPDRKVIGIDCSTLIEQRGSLHCVTMQIY